MGQGYAVKQAEGFEKLIAWQKARELTRVIYDATQRGSFSRDFGLASQMQRAAVSIMSNIAEGYERDNRKEYLRFVLIAKASCAELRSQLYVALDAGYLSEPEFASLVQQAQEVGRILGGLRVSLKRNIESLRRTAGSG
ncbi:MAG: four helix bundle protein [Anaerolineae bacterium]|nr:four helix bundle protein [Anaerolineae bacterium]